MNFFTVTMLVAAACMSGYFVPMTLAALANCYECKQDAVSTCGKAEPGATTTVPIACAAPSKCYAVHVEDTTTHEKLGVLRGCAAEADADCAGAPIGTHALVAGTCIYCSDVDNCNAVPFVEAGNAPASDGAGSGNAPASGGAVSGNGTGGSGNGTAPGSGHPPSCAGSVMLCAFMSSLAIASRMFYNTAV